MGKIREVKTTVLQTETWIFTNKQWKLKLVDNVHDQKRFIDGKRVDPTKPYNQRSLHSTPDTKKPHRPGGYAFYSGKYYSAL